MDNDNAMIIVQRLLYLLAFSFIYIYIVALAIGRENKAKWFKKRTKSSVFTRRGFMGEYINFGYPTCIKGVLVMILIYGVIFALGYFCLFVQPL